jgi:hypothetical protein
VEETERGEGEDEAKDEHGVEQRRREGDGRRAAADARADRSAAARITPEGPVSIGSIGRSWKEL